MGLVSAVSPLAIEARQVTKVFGTGLDQVVALDRVDVSIRENEFFILLGPSGCGKTTLLRMIAGFDHPSDGHIYLNGDNISGLPPYQRPVNTVFQSYALFPHMTVAENIGFGLKMQARPQSEIDQTVDKMLDLVKMQPMRNRRTGQISGGQQQRVALARALAPAPKVLLLDEPLSALDLKLRKEMQIELKRLQHETGITFIFVTHDQEEALTMSDRIAVMSAGKVLQIGSPRDIYDHPADRFVASFIGDTNFITAEVQNTKSNSAKVKLSSGKTITAGLPDGVAVTKGQEVSLVVRPEHCKLSTNKNGAVLSGTLHNIIYFGTDTHYHVTLPNNDLPFIIRMQNSSENTTSFKLKQDVAIKFDTDAAQVLRD